MTEPLPELPRVRAPELPDSLDWIHTGGHVPRLAELRGRVVLLDFWTYGCINCIHLAAQLHELTRRFPDTLVALGVHSGKHPAERVTARIREASLRLGVTHPVLNDRQFRVWRAFAVNAWPTLVLIDPAGYVVASRGGERTADELAPVVARLAESHAAAGTLDTSPLPAWAHGIPDAPAVTPGALCYPTKVALDAAHTRLAIADSAHHRVLVGTLAARDRLRVERVVGRGTPTSADGHVAQGATRAAFADRADGPAERASFERPQGLTFGGDGRLYVADAGNHAVRVVDERGAVRTLAGTGARVRTRDDRREGALASPWDVALVGRTQRTLVVAMAGTHQLWAIDLDTEDARPLAGGRGEAIVDAPLLDALLAQPMGLAAGDARVAFADAESSAVREAELAPDGAVHTLVGTGLFDFGDRDGEGDAVRLQHAQGLARHADGRLLVADSYNDTLKWLDPATRRVTTWRRGFHEPAGVALGDGVAYVADTNAHRVAVVDLETGEGHFLSIEGL
jgi:DNA-binding beta-propeller fold protein YncE